MTDSSHTAPAAMPVAVPDATDRQDSSCLGRTCLKWGADGELAPVDLLLVLERLAQVDQEVTGLRQNSLDSQPCASVS
jgi:hypothetical protein